MVPSLYLEQLGIISKEQTKDQEQEFQLPISDEDVFSKLQASSITYRFATGKSKGKKAIVLKILDDGDHNSPSGLLAEHSRWRRLRFGRNFLETIQNDVHIFSS